MPKRNGVELGPGSPLLTKRGAKRYLGPDEHQIQAAYITAIMLKLNVIPDLDTLHAIPNSVGASKGTQGRRKAEGVVRGMPDTHWPVARGPFIGLWIEFKQPGKYPNAEQRAKIARLKEQGHCVVVCDEVQHAVDVTLRYDEISRLDEPGSPLRWDDWDHDRVAVWVDTGKQP